METTSINLGVPALVRLPAVADRLGFAMALMRHSDRRLTDKIYTD